MNWITKEDLKTALFGAQPGRAQLSENYLDQLQFFQEKLVGRLERTPIERVQESDQLEAFVDAGGEEKKAPWERPFTKADKVARIAPSMVSRDEAILLELSKPRFAVRLYLDTGHRSFMNLRRLADLWLYVDDNLFAPGAPINARTLIVESSFVCDSLIDHRLSDVLNSGEWKVLSVELGTSYGETGHDEAHPQPIRGTPYTQFLNIAGACSGSVCFMATALMHDYAKYLPGIAEINSVLSNNRLAPEIRIGSFSEFDMVSFFQNGEIGLNAWRELLLPDRAERSEAGPSDSLHARMKRILDAYIGSGFPVIWAVDHRKLIEAYKECDAWNEELWPKLATVANVEHCILVVGSKIGSNEILVNDPSWSPFRQLTTAGLLHSRLQEDDAGANENGPAFFIPVIPSGVHLPLGWVDSDRHQKDVFRRYRPGALYYATILQEHAYTAGWPIPVKPCGVRDRIIHSEWRLVQIDVDAPVEDHDLRGAPEDLFKKGWESLRQAIVHRRNVRTRWCWLQYYQHEHLWIWDAELQPGPRAAQKDGKAIPVSDQIAEYVLVAVDPRKLYPASPEQPVPAAVPANERSAAAPADAGAEMADKSAGPGEREGANEPEIEPSLISSFSVFGLEHSLQNWPRDPSGAAIIKNVELYCFMLDDVGPLLGVPRVETGMPRIPTPLEAMAQIAQTDAEAASSAVLVADRIMDLLAVYDPKGELKIRSFASYLPELASWNSAKRDAGRRALRFLVELADQLRARKHIVQTIELVGGSRIGQFAATEDNLVYIAQQRDPREVLDLLRESLLGVRERAEEVGIRFALELEPGRFFALNETQVAQSFIAVDDKASLVADDESFIAADKPFCYFNLDIAHCVFIKKCSTSAAGPLSGSIAHVHICDHSEKCHMDDLSLYAVHSQASGVFQEWVRFLRGLPKNGNGFQTFDGLASLEMESVKSDAMLKACAASLVDLL
jgi:sugar phosphate isomerase/epimerase